MTYNLLADPADSQATLSWSVTPDPAETITKFQYRQKRDTGGWDRDPWLDIPNSNPSGPNSKTYTYTVTGLTNCKTYSFQVRAIYDIGSANDSNTDSAKPTAESAVTFDSGVVPLTVPENTPAGGDIGGPITATGGSCPPIGYSLSGVDAGSFDIMAESGQLQTKAALDYESKSSYSVTVKADDNNGGTATIDVTVTVTDVNEPPEFDSATATREVPENTEAGENIGAPVTANDPDTGDTQTYTVEGADADSFDIDSASGQIQTKSGVTYDHETKSSYSVTVEADDNNGGTATIDVTITVADVNEPPEFDWATATREVPENTEAGENIGAPVTANDPDTGDTLTYTLEGADLDSFGIDSASGQIQTKSGVTYDHEIKSSYSVTVKADDNNGGTATIDVTITVADVNEPPKFSVETASRTIAENTTTGVAIGAPVTATDPDTGDTPAYTLGGTDATFFDIDTSTGQLRTKAALDHETKSSYTVAVTASDGALTAAMDVTVKVTNIDEAGTVALSTNQPPARAEITAALTDPDKGITGAFWQWERSSDRNTDWADIGTSSPSYTPVDGDVGYRLRATASYTDGHGPGKTAQAVSTQAVQAGANRPPEFDPAAATREVPENTEAGGNIGAPVTATDPDSDTLTYSLRGVNAGSFDIVAESGRLQTKAALDYETRNSYIVTVTATDPSNATGEVTVTITVTDEDEGGSVTLSTNQPRASSELTASLTDSDAPVTGTTWQWASSSTAQGTYGDITGATSASYTPVAGDVGKYLRATASYTDKFASNKNAQAVSAAVRAAPPPPPAPPLPPSNTAPEFPGTPATRTVAENTAAGEDIGQPVTATDSDTLTYSLVGVDASSFSIVSTSGQLQTKAVLDYETRNSYTVTVTATDPSNATGEVTVTITVTNEDEEGSVTLSSPQPRVSSELSATLNDPDAGVTSVTWQWASASTAQGTYVSISVATSASYTPVAGDVGKFLRATASYTDGEGGSKTAAAASANAVQAATQPPPSNTAPEFPGTPATRTVAENTAAGVNIGNPIAATDPDSDTLTYSLVGADASSFSNVSTSGQLQTKAALDYETRNSYTVTLGVRDGKDAAGNADTAEDASITVTITVNNVEEPGVITLSSVQPQVGTAFTAILSDPDGGITGESWVWARDESATGAFTDSTSTTSASYMPAANDVGKFLRATASYTDDEGGSKNAAAVSANAVKAAPEFPGTPATRTVAVNTAAGVNIGNPIAATATDSDTLTYSLGGADVSSFSIVGTSGQLQTKAALDYETRSSYTVTVSVDDGKADDGSPNEEPDDTITVTITVTDVDEPPGKPDAPTVGTASTNGHNTLTVTWTAPANTGPAITGYDVEYRKQGAAGWQTNNVTVSGAGATITGALPDTNYEARVRAKNDEGTGEWSEPGTGRSGITPPAQQKNLTVSYQPEAYTVNEGDSGSVTVTLDSASDRALQVPITITAGTAETGDYQVSGLSGGALAFATGASSASFTVEAVQDTDTSNETLTLGFGQLPGKVTAGTHSTAGITINDDDPPAVNNPPPSRHGGSSSRRSGGSIVGSGSIVNQAPVFTEGGSAVRSVAETTAAGTNIGAPVAATDADRDPIAYTLKGVDRAYFALNNGSGQLSTRDTLDFEVKSRYSVSLLATDAKGGSDSIIVTITVTDVDEVPITNPGTQAVAVFYPGTGTIITTPDGIGSVTIPAGSRPVPYHVRVDSDPANCGDGAAGEELRVCLTVEIFDSQGNPEPDAVLDRPAIVQMTLDPGELGGADVVLKAHELGGLRFYFRHDSDDEWAEMSFTVQANAERAAAAARSFGNFAVATDTEVFALAALPAPTPTPTPTIIPAAPVAVAGPPSSTASEPGGGPAVPPLVSAGPVAPEEETGGFPWWLLLLIAAAVLITATGIYVAMRRRKVAAVPVADLAEEDPSEVARFKAPPPVAVPVAVSILPRTDPAIAAPPQAPPAVASPARAVPAPEGGVPAEG